MARYVYAGGLHIAKISGADTVWYHADVLGSTRKMTKEDGTVYDWAATYYPFGEMTQTGNGANTHGFTGKEFDPEMGLNYFCLRYYDPQIGRFMTLDPFGGYVELPQSQNRYAYVMNNPLKYIDPLGLYKKATITIGPFIILEVIPNQQEMRRLLCGSSATSSAEYEPPLPPIDPTFEDLVYRHMIPGWTVDENGNVVRILPYQSLSDRPVTTPVVAVVSAYHKFMEKNYPIHGSTFPPFTPDYSKWIGNQLKLYGAEDIWACADWAVEGTEYMNAQNFEGWLFYCIQVQISGFPVHAYILGVSNEFPYIFYFDPYIESFLRYGIRE